MGWRADALRRAPDQREISIRGAAVRAGGRHRPQFAGNGIATELSPGVGPRPELCRGASTQQEPRSVERCDSGGAASGGAEYSIERGRGQGPNIPRTAEVAGGGTVDGSVKTVSRRRAGAAQSSVG